MKKFLVILGIFILIFIATTKIEAKKEKMSKSTGEKNLLVMAYKDGFKAFEKEEIEKKKQEEKRKQEERLKKGMVINASAYTAAADECGKSDGITASGKKVKENHTLACPKNYKFGTKIYIENMGVYTCEDRGGAIKGNHFDIYMETKQEAFRFGRRNLKAYVMI